MARMVASARAIARGSEPLSSNPAAAGLSEAGGGADRALTSAASSRTRLRENRQVEGRGDMGQVYQKMLDLRCVTAFALLHLTTQMAAQSGLRRTPTDGAPGHGQT